MITLVVGAVLALLALAFVLYPLFAPAAPGRAVGRPGAGGAGLTPERERALAALHEIEFEHATGKLSDSDHERLRAEYARAAAPAPGAAADDPVEGFIRAHRARQMVCPSCGPRPEPDARYCSTCGRDLAGACPRCGAPAVDPGARFCASCGAALAP